MDLARARGEYLDYLSVERGSSPNTVEAYGRDLDRYLTFLAQDGVTTPDAVTREEVRSHIEALEDVGLAPASVERAVSAIKGFHRFMVAEQITEVHPTADLPLPAKPSRLPDVISREQAAAALGPDNDIQTQVDADRLVWRVTKGQAWKPGTTITFWWQSKYAPEGPARAYRLEADGKSGDATGPFPPATPPEPTSTPTGENPR